MEIIGWVRIWGLSRACFYEGCAYTCVYVYTSCICHAYIYAYICCWARVNAVSGPLSRRPPCQILSLRVYNMPTVSRISRQHVCAQSTNYAKCELTMHSVYQLCTVSLNVYVNRIRRIRKPYTSRTRRKNVYAYTTYTVYIYTHVHAYTYISGFYGTTKSQAHRTAGPTPVSVVYWLTAVSHLPNAGGGRGHTAGTDAWCVTPKYFNQCANCEVQHS